MSIKFRLVVAAVITAVSLIVPASILPAPAEAHSTIGTLRVAKIGLYKGIVAGYQAEIDMGYVVSWNGCMPHGSCTVYLLGHRTTHGAVFYNVPRLYVGDTYNVYYNGHSHWYRIVRRVIVDRSVGFGAIYGSSVIQTSISGSNVLLLYGQRV